MPLPNTMLSCHKKSPSGDENANLLIMYTILLCINVYRVQIYGNPPSTSYIIRNCRFTDSIAATTGITGTYPHFVIIHHIQSKNILTLTLDSPADAHRFSPCRRQTPNIRHGLKTTPCKTSWSASTPRASHRSNRVRALFRRLGDGHIPLVSLLIK